MRIGTLHDGEDSLFAENRDGSWYALALLRVPMVRTKPAASLCGTNDGVVVDPALTEAPDYEAELAVRVGLSRRGRRAAAASPCWSQP